MCWGYQQQREMEEILHIKKVKYKWKEIEKSLQQRRNALNET